MRGERVREGRRERQSRLGRVSAAGLGPGRRSGGIRGPLRRLRHLAGGAHAQPVRAGGAHEPALPAHQPRLVRRRLGSHARPSRSRRTPRRSTGRCAGRAMRTGRTRTRSSRRGATATSTCRTGRSRAGSAASSSMISPGGTRRRISPSCARWARRCCSVYPRIVARRKDTPFDAEARETLLFKRGPVRRVQPGLRPRHPLRLQYRCGSGGVPDEPAAGGEVVRSGECAQSPASLLTVTSSSAWARTARRQAGTARRSSGSSTPPRSPRSVSSGGRHRVNVFLIPTLRAPSLVSTSDERSRGLRVPTKTVASSRRAAQHA